MSFSINKFLALIMEKEIENLNLKITIIEQSINKLKNSIKKRDEMLEKCIQKIMKNKIQEIEEYFIERIQFLCNDCNKKNSEKYVKILEINKTLKERIQELEIINEYYKNKP